MIESLYWHINNFIQSPKLTLVPSAIGFSFALSVVLVLASMPILRHFGIVDLPDARRAHARPTIRGGGVGLVIAYIITFVLLSFISQENLSIIPLIIAILLVSIVSFMDDVVEVSIVLRLVLHFVSSYICVIYYISPHLIFRGEVPPMVDMALCVFALASFINIYNFMDGIDGISAGQSIHLSLTVLLLCIIRDKVIINIDFVFYSSAILLGCSMAFLIFNWNPAKIFMGDVGSIFFGLLHGLNLLVIATSSERLFLASAIASLYYIGDGGLTIFIRAVKGEKIWLPHLNHFFQQAVRKGMGHKEIVIKIAICNVILLMLAIYSIYYPHIAVILAILNVTTLLIHFHK